MPGFKLFHKGKFLEEKQGELMTMDSPYIKERIVAGANRRFVQDLWGNHVSYPDVTQYKPSGIYQPGELDELKIDHEDLWYECLTASAQSHRKMIDEGWYR